MGQDYPKRQLMLCVIYLPYWEYGLRCPFLDRLQMTVLDQVH